MSVHGYELISDWKNSQCGKIATATRNGKKYFLKMYQTPVAPLDNGTLDAKTFAHNQALFDDFVSTRTKINESVRTIAGSGGNIVIPCEEFIDGNHYVEVSEFVEGAVGDDELEGVLAGLSEDVKKLLMLTAAGALAGIHRLNIVHSDLKLKNVLLARNGAGNYVAKLIDFDNSYFVDQKPEEVIGSIDYYSPELGAYADAEDDRKELEKNLTEKSDIFSLGLIYHYYLSGELPTPATLTDWMKRRREQGRVIYCWVVLNSGCELRISPKIKSAKYVSLIRDMLSLDPKDRPSALEVLKRLREAEPAIEEPWPEHSLVLDKEKLRAEGVVGLKKIDSDKQKKYQLLYSDGKKQTVGRDELLSKGFAGKITPTGFTTPWPEHGIEFDIEKIKSRGFVYSEQTVFGGIKGYNFYRSDSFSKFFKAEDLLMMKYARKKSAAPVTVEFELPEPWPEHSIAFDADAIKSRGYARCERQVMNGVNGYNFVRADGGNRFIRPEIILLQKMARKI